MEFRNRQYLATMINRYHLAMSAILGTFVGCMLFASLEVARHLQTSVADHAQFLADQRVIDPFVRIQQIDPSLDNDNLLIPTTSVAAEGAITSAVTTKRDNKTGDRSELFMPLGFTVRNRTIALEVLNTLWMGNDPMAYALASNIDHGYPHTNIMTDLIALILEIVRPVFWLEVGSMLGGSAIKVALAVKEGKFSTSIVCMDPWTGDVNMWAWEEAAVQKGHWRFLRLQKGIPTIYDRFRANVVESGQADVIIPIVTSSLVGMKLLSRLKFEQRISSMPHVIYLDSAHEQHETLTEITLAWRLLAPGGVLWGDDWRWEAVRVDVEKFARSLDKAAVNGDLYRSIAKSLQNRRTITYSAKITCMIIDDSQWIISKSDNFSMLSERKKRGGKGKKVRKGKGKKRKR